MDETYEKSFWVIHPGIWVKHMYEKIHVYGLIIDFSMDWFTLAPTVTSSESEGHGHMKPWQGNFPCLTRAMTTLEAVRNPNLADLAQKSVGYLNLVGGPGPPLWKILVNWDDEIPNIWENKKCSKPPTRNVINNNTKKGRLHRLEDGLPRKNWDKLQWTWKSDQQKKDRFTMIHQPMCVLLSIVNRETVASWLHQRKKHGEFTNKRSVRCDQPEILIDYWPTGRQK